MKLPLVSRLKINHTLNIYILYYFSIAMLAIILVFISFFSVSAKTLNTSLTRAENEKLDLVAKDLETQLDQIMNVSYSIRSSIFYQPAYFGRSRYYEMAIIEDLKKYMDRTPIMSDYFLLYEGDRNIFHPLGKTSFDLYAAANLGWPEDDVQALYDSVTGSLATRAIRLPCGDFLLTRCIEFYSSGTGRSGSRGWFCAYVPLSALKRRIELCSGGFESRYEIVLGAEEQESIATRTVGEFSISLLHSENAEYSEVQRFRVLCTRLSILFTVCLALAALIFAYLSYRPIHRIIVRHNVLREMSSVRSGDAFSLMDNALTQAVRHRQLSEKQIDALSQELNNQHRNLHELLLFMLLNGEYSPKISPIMDRASLRLNGPYLATFVLHWEKEVTPAQEHACIDSIESLSDDDAHYYAIRLDTQPVLAVVASSSDSESLSQLPDILQEIVQMEIGQPLRIGCGYPVTNPAQLSDSFSSALVDMDQDDSMSILDKTLIKLLLESIQNANCSAALSALNEINDTLTNANVSGLTQRFAYRDIVNQIVILSRRLGMPLTQGRIETFREQPLSERCQRELRLIIVELCEHARADDSLRQNDPRGEKIVAYIKNHLSDYNMTLESLAGVFGLSSKQINRILVQETGLSYKKILTDLYIQRAKDLLIQGESVVSVCEQLHYSSVPYFIRLFREKTGFTPAKFRSLHAGEGNYDDPSGV